MKITRMRKITTDTGYETSIEATVDFTGLTPEQVCEHAFNPIWITKQAGLRKMTNAQVDALGGKMLIIAVPSGQRTAQVLTPEQLTAKVIEMSPERKRELIKEMEASMNN